MSQLSMHLCKKTTKNFPGNLHPPVSQKVICCLLQSCIDNGDITAGREVLDFIVKVGYDSNAFLGSYLIRMFALCGDLLEANHVFSKLSDPDVFSWSAIISAFAKYGKNKQAIRLYKNMQKSSAKPDGHVFVAALKACAGMASLNQGKLIHAHICGSPFKSDLYVCNTLIDMYAKCGSLKDAYEVFADLPNQDLVTWNTLIAGYVQHDYWQEAFRLFEKMQLMGFKPNQITFVCILKAYSRMSDVGEGKVFHAVIIGHGFEWDIIVSNALIDMYAKCGSLKDAHALFAKFPKKNVVTWSAMIAGYAEHGCGQEALSVFEIMQQERVKPNEVTFISALKACMSIGVLDQGKLIHAHIIKTGLEFHTNINNTIVGVYANCGALEDADRVFDKLSKRDVVTWNTIITAYAQHEHGQKAFQLFRRMQQECMEPDRLTFVSILKACIGTAALTQGKLFHAQIIEIGFELDSAIGNTLISMYAKFGSLQQAHKIFVKLPKQSVVTWNAIVGAYAHHGQVEEALQLYQQMKQQGTEPNEVTFVCILKACSDINAREQGGLVYTHILKSGCEFNVYITSALISMYIMCGCFEDAQNVFETSQNRSVVTWSAMIAGFSQRSDYKSALKCFKAMQDQGVKPDNVAYISLLSACSHMGLLDEGDRHIKLMTEGHGIAPKLEHYNCMVDLLGRAGHLNEAAVLLQSMPFETNVVSWTSLLGHCRTYGNVELGKRCFNHIHAIDSRNSAGCFLMSSIYAHAGMHENADDVEEHRKHKNAWKKPGKAFIEVGLDIHEFIVGDKSHPQKNAIYARLQKLDLQIREEGYIIYAMPALY